jgi:hypothetical protein
VGTLRSLPDSRVEAEFCKTIQPPEIHLESSFMNKALRPEKEFLTEVEAAAALGISVQRIHELLDAHIFNDGSARPTELTFRASDLVLLKFWDRGPDDRKIIRMPVRRA